MQSLKKKLTAASYGVFGFITAMIFVRILLKALGANPDAGFVVFWYSFSDFFVGMFEGIYPSIAPEGSNIIIETYSVIAMLFYMILSYLTAKSATTVTEESSIEIFKNILDVFFKFFEFFLIGRFLLRLTGASIESSFVSFMYSVSALVYEPFKNIFPTIKIENFDIVFETSTLLAIVVIILFDIVTEGIIDNLRNTFAKGDKKTVPAVVPPAPPAPVTHHQGNNGQGAQGHAGGANITINIPQPQQPSQTPQTQNIDRRTVNVYPGHTNYPGQGQNHLEGQRPADVQQLPGNSASTKPLPGADAARNPNTGGGQST